MAVKLDNMDEVLTQLAKLEKAAVTSVIRTARAKMRKLMRAQIPAARNASPEGETGRLKKAPKVKSRSRRGVSSASLIWDMKPQQVKKRKPKKTFIMGVEVEEVLEPEEPKVPKPFVNYAPFVNFKKNKSEKFATDLWNKDKAILDQEGLKIVRESFEEVFKSYGVKFK